MVYYITVSTYKKFKQLLRWNGYNKVILNFFVCLLGNFGLAALDTGNMNTLHLRFYLTLIMNRMTSVCLSTAFIYIEDPTWSDIVRTWNIFHLLSVPKETINMPQLIIVN